MPRLAALLNAHDLGFLQALAETWGLDCPTRDAQTLARCLASKMPAPGLLNELLEALPPNALQALSLLKRQGGSMPWAEFTRHFGELRPMGPARRGRELPWRFPHSVTERLWYQGLIGRDFMRLQGELLEAAYIPDEFLGLVPSPAQDEQASPALMTRDRPRMGQSQAAPILEDSCTLLAALRRQESARLAETAGLSLEDQRLLAGLLQGLGLLGADGRSPTAAARPFLEQNRAQALAWLVQTWQGLRAVNELRLVPSLRCEGTWQNDPLPPRRFLLKQVAAWQGPVLLEDFLQQMQQEAFSFLRPPVESAAWMIASSQDPKTLLRGPQSWPLVEGAWLRLMLSKVLPWLGLVATSETEAGLVLEKSPAFDGLNNGQVPAPFPEDDRVKVDASGLLSISTQVPRIARYQLSRFGAWLAPAAGNYPYQISAAALEEAASQGLTVKHLLSLLRKYAKSSPQALVRSLRRWETEGNLIKLQNLQVLRLAKPELLPALREGPAGKYLGEALGPDAVVFKGGSLAALQKDLLRQGFLAALPPQPDPDA